MSFSTSTLRSILVLATVLVVISAPAYAIKFNAGMGSSSGAFTAFGEYRLQKSASLDSDLTLDEGVVSRLSSAGGIGKNAINEGVSNSQSSVTNTVTSDGSFKVDSNDFASGAGAASTYRTTLSGASGSFCSASFGEENEMLVAGGFSGQGDMDASLTSVADREALTTGSASARGTPILNDELVQGIRGQDAAVSVQGLYMAGENGLGEFGMVAQNAKGSSAASASASTVGYKLNGYMWAGNNPSIPMVLASDLLPTGISMDEVKVQISAAQASWDAKTTKRLFSNLGTITGSTGTYNQDYSKWSTSDGKNVLLWTSDTGLGSSTIAMTVTWYKTPFKTVRGADGRYYYQAVESDCWYNNNLNWRIDKTAGQKISNSFDIQTITLHELGHTLGLADLYNTADKARTMYGYNDGTSDWTLDSGDITGLQKLYGK